MEYIQESLFGRTYPEPLAVTEDKILGQSLKKSQRPKFQCLQVVNGQLQEWLEGTDVVLRGECLTRNIGEYPNAERESSLSQILQDSVPEKYFLSARATIGILRRAAKRGKELPPVLRMALEEQSGLRRDTIGQKEITDTGALLRKLWETVDKTTFEQWLRGSLVLVQQKKILRFDLLCGVEKETAEKAEVCEVGQGCSEVTDTEGELRELWETGCNGHPPQGWEPVKQFARELNKALQEVSYQRTPAEVFLLCMWQASESEKSLRQSLQGVYAEVGEGAASSDNVITSWSPKMWKEGSGATNPLLATDYKDPQVVIRRGVSGDFAESRKAREEVAAGAGDGIRTTSYGLDSYNQTMSEEIINPIRSASGGDTKPMALVAYQQEVKACYQNGQGDLFVNDVTCALATNGNPSGRNVPLMLQPQGFRMIAFGEYTDDDTASAMKARDYKDATDLVVPIQLYDMTHADEVIRQVEPGISPTLNARMGTGGNQIPIHLDRAAFNQGENALYDFEVSAADVSSSLVARGPGAVSIPPTYTVRRLTPMECERLQGFPDNWTDIPGASDTGRYKALGNSVAVPCVSWIIGRIAESVRMP